jgi:hypothetical protein
MNQSEVRDYYLEKISTGVRTRKISGTSSMIELHDYLFNENHKIVLNNFIEKSIEQEDFGCFIK